MTIKPAKEDRCRKANCPECGTGNPKCAQCTGPVAIRDGETWTHGRARSCHSCPMNGLGLAVCWACCPGPNGGFATDGQSIVSTDTAESSEELIYKEAEVSFVYARNCRQSDADQGRPIEAAISALRKLLRFSSQEWEVVRRLVNSQEPRDKKAAAAKIGIAASSLIRSTPTAKLIAKLAQVSGVDWDCLRTRISSENASESASKLQVTKQAISKRETALRIKYAWYGQFIDDLRNADRPFYCSSGVIAPTGSDNGERKPSGVAVKHNVTRAGARDANSLSH